MPVTREMLLTELQDLLRLTAFEQTIATVRRTQARTTPLAQELAANAEKAAERLNLLKRAVGEVGGVPDVVGAGLGRVGAFVTSQLNQVQTLQGALLGDLTLEHQLRERTRYARTLAVSLGETSLLPVLDRLETAHSATIEWLEARLSEVGRSGSSALAATPVQVVVGTARRLAALPYLSAAKGINSATGAVARLTGKAPQSLQDLLAQAGASAASAAEAGLEAARSATVAASDVAASAGDTVVSAAEQAQDTAAKAAGQAQEATAQAAAQAQQAAGAAVQQAEGAATQAAEKAEDVAGKAGEAARNAADTVADTAGSAATQAADVAGAAADKTQGAVAQAADTASDTVAKAGDAAGSAADQASDAAATAADKAKDAAGTATDKAEDVAASVADTASDAAAKTGEAAGNAAQKAGEAAGSAADTAAATAATAADAAQQAAQTTEQVLEATGGADVDEVHPPFAGYEKLTGDRIINHIADTEDVEELRQTLAFEQAHKARKGVVGAAQERLTALVSS